MSFCCQGRWQESCGRLYKVGFFPPFIPFFSSSHHTHLSFAPDSSNNLLHCKLSLTYARYSKQLLNTHCRMRLGLHSVVASGSAITYLLLAIAIIFGFAAVESEAAPLGLRGGPVGERYVCPGVLRIESGRRLMSCVEQGMLAATNKKGCVA